MRLVDRAAEFVDCGHPRNLSELLLACVGARDSDGLAAVQRLAEDMYDGITFNYFLKSPAAWCLVA